MSKSKGKGSGKPSGSGTHVNGSGDKKADDTCGGNVSGHSCSRCGADSIASKNIK